jgi:hypothetical protein
MPAPSGSCRKAAAPRIMLHLLATVPWHKADVFGAAAIRSDYRGTSTRDDAAAGRPLMTTKDMSALFTQSIATLDKGYSRDHR